MTPRFQVRFIYSFIHSFDRSIDRGRRGWCLYPPPPPLFYTLWSYCSVRLEKARREGLGKGRRENRGDGGDDSRPLREKEKKVGRTVLEK